MGSELLLRCVREFTTKESGFPFTIMEGTVWYKYTFEYTPGGYETVVLEKVTNGSFTGVVARVRYERISECFESIPFMECPEPKGRDDGDG